jgi:hypothetical protein
VLSICHELDRLGKNHVVGEEAPTRKQPEHDGLQIRRIRQSIDCQQKTVNVLDLVSDVLTGGWDNLARYC